MNEADFDNFIKDNSYHIEENRAYFLYKLSEFIGHDLIVLFDSLNDFEDSLLIMRDEIQEHRYLALKNAIDDILNDKESDILKFIKNNYGEAVHDKVVDALYF